MTNVYTPKILLPPITTFADLQTSFSEQGYIVSERGDRRIEIGNYPVHLPLPINLNNVKPRNIHASSSIDDLISQHRASPPQSDSQRPVFSHQVAAPHLSMQQFTWSALNQPSYCHMQSPGIDGKVQPESFGIIAPKISRNMEIVKAKMARKNLANSALDASGAESCTPCALLPGTKKARSQTLQACDAKEIYACRPTKRKNYSSRRLAGQVIYMPDLRPSHTSAEFFMLHSLETA